MSKYETVVAVDPGLRACGAAVWDHGTVAWAGAVRGPKSGSGPEVWRELARWLVGTLRARGYEKPDLLVVEQMKVYVQGKGDPADLLELQGVAGAIVGAAPSGEVRGVLAREWNGQVPAPIRRQRTRAWVESIGALDRVDLNTTARFQQDVWSALGILRHVVTG